MRDKFDNIILSSDDSNMNMKSILVFMQDQFFLLQPYVQSTTRSSIENV